MAVIFFTWCGRYTVSHDKQRIEQGESWSVLDLLEHSLTQCKAFILGCFTSSEKYGTLYGVLYPPEVTSK